MRDGQGMGKVTRPLFENRGVRPGYWQRARRPLDIIRARPVLSFVGTTVVRRAQKWRGCARSIGKVAPGSVSIAMSGVVSPAGFEPATY
jgi:hypothetical protein